MSFRIADILKDKNQPSTQDENIKSDNTARQCCCSQNEEQAVSYENSHQVKASCSKFKVDCYIPCLAPQSLEFTTHHHPVSGFTPYQQIKVCCSPAMNQTYHSERIYSAPYLYPEKIYSQTIYNYALPFNFPVLNHYSKRRNQVRFSTSQTKALEHKFSWQKYLSPEDRKFLAYSLKLSDRQVKTWFQNRRAKWRRNLNGSSNNKIDVKPDITSNTVT